MRNYLVALAASAILAVVVAQPAAAAEPVREDFTRDGTAVLTGVCSFPVTVEFTQTGTDTLFFAQDGTLKRVKGHVVEQDVFTANGKTLVGLPYTFNVRVLFDSETGEVTNVFASGVISRVPLAGGNLFLTAGRLDFAAHGSSFLVQPDVGAQGNVEGFCEALSL